MGGRRAAGDIPICPINAANFWELDDWRRKPFQKGFCDDEDRRRPESAKSRPGEKRSKFLLIAQCCGVIWWFRIFVVVSSCLRMEAAAVGTVRETVMSHKCCRELAWQRF